MVERVHETLFADSFKMLEEDKYQNIQENIMEKFDNVTPENRLYLDIVGLIMAIESGDIQEVKDILINAKNSSVFSKEILRSLLLSKNIFGESILYITFERGNSEIVEELLSYCKENDDDNHTLKQLLLDERYGKSALHVAAERGRGDVIKLLLKTATDLGIEMLEKSIISVDEKGKNAIQLLFENGNETIFADSFVMLIDEYPNVWKKVKEMFDNVPLESRLYLTKKKFIMAVGNGDIKEVKDILDNVKNSSLSHNESLRILLFAEDSEKKSILWIACLRGNSEMIKQLISYAKDIDDYNDTLKQLLLDDRSEETALHVAARWGRGDIIKLLLKTAAALGTEVLERFIFAVDMKGKNAIELMIEHDQERIFPDSFKALEEDKHKNIRKNIMEIFANKQPESRLSLHKEKLATAIEFGDIKEVKDILSNYKKFDERLRILLIARDLSEKSLFPIACERGNSEIIKELLSYAINMDDGGATLKEILTKPFYRKIPFPVFKQRYVSVIKPVVESLISEARANNRKDVVNIIEGIDKQHTELKSVSED